jgi:TetR/AcrR family transcriptional regulator, fatty acid metabolism regulator protein
MSKTTPPHSWKERQRAERERLILDAAEEIILEKGYYEMSMDDIAARVGISKGTVYLHFTSKDELVLALLAQHMQKFEDLITQTLHSDLSPSDSLRQLLRKVYRSIASSHFQVMLVLMQQADLREHFLKKKGLLQSRETTIMQGLAALLDAGKACGEFTSAIPTPVMLGILQGMLSPHTFNQTLTQSGLEVDELIDHLIAFFFKGIAPEARPERS